MLAAFRGDCLIAIPLFYQDRFIILWLGLFPYICIFNVFLLCAFVECRSSVCLADVQGFWILLWILVH